MSGKNLIKEAVADAQALREAAFSAAKQKLVEELSPAVKNLVEKALRKSEDVDRLQRAADGYGETEFEESAGDKTMAKEKELEKESLASMFPGISEMADEEEAMEEAEACAPEAEEVEEGIPTLGEAEEAAEEEEEMVVDEEALKAAYESLMKTGRAIEEASVTKGFADVAKKSEWATEDSPPSDRGIEDKEKEVEWEKQTPPAAKDYSVKESIEKGLKANKHLRQYVEHLESQYSKAISLVEALTKQVNSVNLFNQKVCSANEMFNKFKTLTNEQKALVLNKIDKATNIREVKMVAEALKASFETLSLNEGRKATKPNASKVVKSGSADREVLRESVGQNGLRDQFARQRQLAGLNKIVS